MVAAGGGGNVYYDAGEVVGIGGDGGGLVGYYAGSYGTYYSPGIRNQNITEADGGVTNVGTSMNTPHDFAFGGTQKRGGLTNSGSSGGAGTFGVGGNGNGLSAGGGGGYYGGTVTNHNNGGAGAGSSYIKGYPGADTTYNEYQQGVEYVEGETFDDDIGGEG